MSRAGTGVDSKSPNRGEIGPFSNDKASHCQSASHPLTPGFSLDAAQARGREINYAFRYKPVSQSCAIDLYHADRTAHIKLGQTQQQNTPLERANQN